MERAATRTATRFRPEVGGRLFGRGSNLQRLASASNSASSRSLGLDLGSL